MKFRIFFLIFILLLSIGGLFYVLNKNNYNKIQNKDVIRNIEINNISTGLILTGLISKINLETGSLVELNKVTIDKILIQTGIINNQISNKEFDFITDYSITKYVSNKEHYNKINYIPNDLVSIKGDYVIDTKGNQLLRQEAKNNIDNLSKDFYNYFAVKLSIVSAYRSYNYQVGIKAGGCGDNFCAKAGYSEHQSGLAVDIFETTTKDEFLSKKNLKNYYNWMKENAYKYGFHNTYQKGKKIDGYEIEPWHWRYLGIELATDLQEKNMTFGEYFNNN